MKVKYRNTIQLTHSHDYMNQYIGQALAMSENSRGNTNNYKTQMLYELVLNLKVLPNAI